MLDVWCSGMLFSLAIQLTSSISSARTCKVSYQCFSFILEDIGRYMASITRDCQVYCLFSVPVRAHHLCAQGNLRKCPRRYPRRYRIWQNVWVWSISCHSSFCSLEYFGIFWNTDACPLLTSWDVGLSDSWVLHSKLENCRYLQINSVFDHTLGRKLHSDRKSKPTPYDQRHYWHQWLPRWNVLKCIEMSPQRASKLPFGRVSRLLCHAVQSSGIMTFQPQFQNHPEPAFIILGVWTSWEHVGWGKDVHDVVVFQAS